MTGSLSLHCCRQMLHGIFHSRLNDIEKIQKNDDRDGNPDKP